MSSEKCPGTPIYTYYFGICVLALSKAFMFEFHYDYIKISTTSSEACYFQTMII